MSLQAQPRCVVGVDVGGTNIKSVLLRFADGGVEVSHRLSEPTQNDSPQSVIDHVGELGVRLRAEHPQIEGLGLTIPGTVDVQRGTTGVVPNIPGNWRDFQVAAPVAEHSGLPTTLINDARAFSLAESRLGAGQGLGTVVCMALGTGVGGGVVIGGRVHGGHTGMAGEIGHQTVDVDGPECGCGNVGCVEALTRADVFAARAGTATPKEAFEAAAAGDERAIGALDAQIRYLAIALANSYMLLCPDVMILGGGIASAGDQLLVPLQDEVRRRMTLDEPENVRVVPAQLGVWAGAIGAGIAAAQSAGIC